MRKTFLQSSTKTLADFLFSAAAVDVVVVVIFLSVSFCFPHKKVVSTTANSKRHIQPAGRPLEAKKIYYTYTPTDRQVGKQALPCNKQEVPCEQTNK